MPENVTSYLKIIRQAKAGDDSAVHTLREILKNLADLMPPGSLIYVSEAVLDARREEVLEQIRRN